MWVNLPGYPVRGGKKKCTSLQFYSLGTILLQKFKVKIVILTKVSFYLT